MVEVLNLPTGARIKPHDGRCLFVGDFYFFVWFSLFAFSFGIRKSGGAIMAEELADLCRRIKLSNKEKHRISLRKDLITHSKQEAQFSILFKLLTIRPFNKEAFKGTVRSLWSGPRGVTIREIEENLFLAVL